MFNFLFKKEKQVQVLIFNYLDTLKLAQDNFTKALDSCLEGGCRTEADFFIDRTHKYEAKADDIREEIKSLMYGKALVPDSRGDIMGLLESIDIIPHRFERILYIIQTQKLEIPGFLVLDIKELIRISLECCDLMDKQVRALLSKTNGIRSLMNTIDANESHCDHIERRIIVKVFDSELDPFCKLQLKDLIVQMGDISDEADRVSRRINIISMKRRV